eukprot:12921453-Prorocentrum_lima.AAC.1
MHAHTHAIKEGERETDVHTPTLHTPLGGGTLVVRPLPLRCAACPLFSRSCWWAACRLFLSSRPLATC